MAITLLAGQASGKAAVAGLPAMPPTSGDVVADRGHDACATLDLIAGGRGHVPTRRDRKIQRKPGPALCRQRNRVDPRRENGPPDRSPILLIFSRLRQFRKVATRCGKTAGNCRAAVLIACSRLWMRACEADAWGGSTSPLYPLAGESHRPRRAVRVPFVRPGAQKPRPAPAKADTGLPFARVADVSSGTAARRAEA